MRVWVVGVVLLAAATARAQEEPLPPVPPPPGALQPVPPPPPDPAPPPPPAAQPAPRQATPQPPHHQRQPAPPPPPAPTGDASRRSGWEMPELYATGFALGTMGTVTALMALDTEEAGYYALLPGLGGTAGIITVLLLDRNTSIRRGMPSAISMFALVGLGEGLLLWPAVAPDLSATGVMSLLVLGSTAGAGLGAVVGHALGPEPADNRLSLTTALWGGAIGLFSAMSFDLPVTEHHWRIALAGYGGGAVLGTLLGAVTEPSDVVLGLFNGGIFVGGLVGLGIAGLVHEVSERRGGDTGPETVAAGLAIGMGSGVLLGVMLVGLESADRSRRAEEADPAEADPEDPEEAAPPVQIGVAPLPGGAILSASAPL